MIKADGHLHSFFSFDGKASIAEMAAEAFARDLSTITMAEHFSVCSFDPSYQVLEYETYSREISTLQHQYQGKMEIRKGLEIGEPHVRKQDINAFLQGKRLDIIIGSLHNIGQVKLRQTMEGKERRQIYQDYFDALLLMVQEGDMDVVGHFDYICRYAPYPDKKMYYRDFPSLFDTIFSLCIEKGKALELNTRTSAIFLSENRNDFMFDIDILTRYRKMGGELITFGSDAHQLDSILTLFNETKTILKETGFKNLVYYKQRSPIFVPI